MNKSDLYPGMKVRIISWKDKMPEDRDPYDYRPEHWCGDGEMDSWQGVIVTIQDCSSLDNYVFIKEDNGDWQWYPSDFDFYCVLPADNPNEVYKRLIWQSEYTQSN